MSLNFFVQHFKRKICYNVVKFMASVRISLSGKIPDWSHSNSSVNPDPGRPKAQNFMIKGISVGLEASPSSGTRKQQ